MFYHLSIFAMLNQDYEHALAYIDSIQALGFDDPELMLRRGLAYQAMGDPVRAEAAYQEAVAASPNRPEPVQALYKFYLEEVYDTMRAKRVIESWLKRAPSDSVAHRLLRSLS